MQTKVSIGQVKRDISELVNRVAYAGDRIVLTSRGKPKAALISIEDYERLTRAEQKPSSVQAWLEKTQQLSAAIHERRGSAINVDELLCASRADLEER
jgi:prevent-host-death family protein